MILAILIGIAFHNLVGTPARAKAGVTFSLRRILRLAIILLGLQLTAAQVAEVGPKGVGVIIVTLLATFAFTKWLGAILGVDRKLAELIAAGTSICGASAVIATNTVTNAHDEDVAYAVACVTVFGSIAMFAYPLLPGLLQLSPHAYGLWAGASIHEIAQVVAAAFQDGKAAGDFGTIAKLSRVMMLAPVVIGLGFLTRLRAEETHHRAAAPVPWFVLGFVALVGLNSLIDRAHGAQVRHCDADDLSAVDGAGGDGARDGHPQTARQGVAAPAARLADVILRAPSPPATSTAEGHHITM